MWVCIGHSHIAALASGAEMIGLPVDEINFWSSGADAWSRDEAGYHLRADLAERTRQGSVVISAVGGSAHVMLGTPEHSRPFDFILPSDPELPVDESRELVPGDAVKAMMIEVASEYLDMIPTVLRNATGPVIQLEPPPPVADSRRVGAQFPWGFFPGRPREIAPRWLRYKLWRMHSEVIAEACARLGVVYVRSPDRAKDGDGFLDARYDQDGAHGNGDYGVMVLEELRGTI